MPAILSNNVRTLIAESFLNSVYNGSDSFYIVIGHENQWQDDMKPPKPEDTPEFEKNFRNEMIAAVRCTMRNCSLVIPKVPITIGSTMFHPLDMNSPNAYTERGWYGFNESNGYVYQCLKKGPGEVMQVPSEKKAVVGYSEGHLDGYEWKFLFDIDRPFANEGLLLNKWVPVPYGKVNESGELVFGTLTFNQLEFGDVYAATTLRAKNILFNVLLTDDENDALPEDISYRQVGILMNPTKGGMTNLRQPVVGDIIIPGEDFDKESGNIVYFENRVPVNRVAGQKESVQIVLSF